MKNKDTSTIATALSWIEGPEFVESSERLATSITANYPANASYTLSDSIRNKLAFDNQASLAHETNVKG